VFVRQGGHFLAIFIILHGYPWSVFCREPISGWTRVWEAGRYISMGTVGDAVCIFVAPTSYSLTPMNFPSELCALCETSIDHDSMIDRPGLGS